MAKAARAFGRHKAHSWQKSAILAVFLFSLFNLKTEWNVQKLIEINKKSKSIDDSIIMNNKSWLDLNGREAFLMAQLLGRSASSPQVSSDETIRLIAQANVMLNIAINARPNWGQPYIVRAFIEGLNANQVNSKSTSYIVKSYTLSPFLSPEGIWRVRYGLADWNNLDELTRRALIEEAIALSQISGFYRRIIETATKSSAADALYHNSKNFIYKSTI
jgi:hypothetical protein